MRQDFRPYLVIGVAILFMWAGWYRGEVATVLTKATAICMECIGIG